MNVPSHMRNVGSICGQPLNASQNPKGRPPIPVIHHDAVIQGSAA